MHVYTNLCVRVFVCGLCILAAEINMRYICTYARMRVCMYSCVLVSVCGLHISVAQINVSRCNASCARGVVPTAFATDMEGQHACMGE